MITDTTRDLLISLASHMAYMQGQLEARHELDDPEDFYWYRESVALRQKVVDALADGPAVPAPPANAEVAELVVWLRERADGNERFGAPNAAAKLTRAAELLQRQAPVPAPVSERLPGPEDCDAEGLCWVWNFTAYTWGMFRLDLTAHSHWLPAHALPLP